MEKDDPSAPDAERGDSPKAAGGRVLTSLMGAEDLKTPEQRKAYAQELAKEVLEAAKDYRKRNGLPPLPKE